MTKNKPELITTTKTTKSSQVIMTKETKSSQVIRALGYSIQESVPCCSVWEAISDCFRWYHLDDTPEAKVMPCINGFRVNHCPSCGANVRMYVKFD